MTRKHSLTKRLLSILLCVSLIAAYIPLAAAAAAATNDHYNRIVDENTMDAWKNYFDLTDLTTANAGGVWTDKSVFKDASAFGGKITMLDSGRNFLTALSAIAANKEVVGYSTVPTDTVLVLDLSGSMDEANAEAALITAANDAIKALLDVNKNNRVGVVMYSASLQVGSSSYSESVTQLLPIDRYTTASDGVYLRLSSQNTVSVDKDVTGTVANADLSKTKTFGGGTYTQAGLWEALKMFKGMDTVIGDNNWQAGDDRMPILVLMTDGAPTTGTTYYADVENSQYTYRQGNRDRTVKASNVGNGNDSDLTAGNAFLTQLTAAYVMNQIEAHYQQKNPDVRGLFYTLGFNNAVNDAYATSVLDPDNSTLTDSLWAAYDRLTTGTLSVNVKDRNGGNSDVAISKNSYITGKSYVDEYFPASSNELASAFKSIVDEIILQSRYYPTHLEGGSPDFSGYVEFTDILGAYMEVKDIKGILLGSTLYDGHMMASKLADTSDSGLGTVQNPTALGDEFIASVKTRLGIASTAEAQALVAKAYAAGQLRYNSDTDWSNYIGWYAKSDLTYAGFWNEASTEAAPEGAVYRIKSYGFLGQTTGSIKNSDMMYMSVQVRTNIATGEQTVLWKIPASLVPLITYSVSLKGSNVEEATNVQISVENSASVSPIRLVFESGLRSDLNELNITRITDAEHIAPDGVTRQFWTNYFDISSAAHEDHVTALAEFTPSKENERFYYTFDSAVFKLVSGSYVLVGENETLQAGGEYYHRRYIFTDDSSVPVFRYEKMSAESVAAAVWKGEYITLTGDTGAWVVPKGTPARELEMYSSLKTDEDLTRSAHMVFYPYLSEQNNTVYVDMNLGNNGLLEITPAQGIKLSKTVDIFETGTSDTFRFRVTVHTANGAPYTGTLNSYITALDEVPMGAPVQITLSSAGVYELDLSRNQTFWLTGIPAGAVYTVEEISNNADYKIKSVHVNGVSAGNVATGTVAAYLIDDVDFVNTAIGEGDLVITKQVVDVNGNPADVSDALEFTANVTLTDRAGNPVSGSFTSSVGTLTVPASGIFTVKLGDGESFVVHGIPEETRYTVEEINIPNGFSLNTQKSILSGVVDATANDQALMVNTYAPTSVSGSGIQVEVTKHLTGNRTQWLPGETYEFVLERIGNGGAAVLTRLTISDSTPEKTVTYTMDGEVYTQPGTYYYRITEKTGTQGGITYDTAERRFNVVVADRDMDGDLQIVSVNNEALTTVTGTYGVSASFNNIYQPTGSAAVTIDVIKKMQGHSLTGFQFALYDSAQLDNEIQRSSVTNAAGQAAFTLNYAANCATVEGAVFTYYLAEINAGNPNIVYDTAVYKVEVTVKDNGDGTISAAAAITPVTGGAMEGGVPTFTNTYIPSASDYIALGGTKRIEGDRVLNAGEFRFTIVADPGTPNAPMPGTTTVTNGVDGAFAFPDIEFNQVGSFRYLISELRTDPIGGFTYDETIYRVSVSVVDNGNATLTASIDKIEAVGVNSTETVSDIVFVNNYDAQDTSVTLSGEKILTGKTMENEEFSFLLSPVTQDAPMPDSTISKNNAGGKFTFGEITYSKAGTYVYTLTEVDGGDARYDYDKSVYTVTVVVTDNSRGVLTARVTLEKNGAEAGEIVFRNGFVPESISYDIYEDFGGEKILSGRPLAAGEFEFVLINAVSGQQVGESVRSDAEGKFRFPAVTLAAPGIYHYKITEVVGDEKNVTYDTASYHIRLNVVQAANGTLSIADKQLHKGTVSKVEVSGVLTEVTVYENISTGGKIVFNNSYTADPVYVTLEATKTLTGRDLVDGEFKFDLHKTAEDYAYSAATVVQDDVVLKLNADGTGSIVFMPEMFDKAGTYHYVIVEDEVAEKGITPDSTAYQVEITVTDNHKGELEAALKVGGSAVTGSTADTVIFRNTYTASGAQIQLRGSKTLNGRDLQEKEFSFELYDAENNKLETVENAASGSFVFAPIDVAAAGEYLFTVREVAGSASGVTYDQTVYTVKVTVTDLLDGTFQLTYAYQADGEEAESIAFVNTYTAPSYPEPPKTGDEHILWLAMPMMVLSATAMLAVMVVGKKKEQ